MFQGNGWRPILSDSPDKSLQIALTGAFQRKHQGASYTSSQPINQDLNLPIAKTGGRLGKKQRFCSYSRDT